MPPYHVQASTSAVEIWTGKRIQFGSESRDDWQKALKADLRQAFSKLDVSQSALIAGYYYSSSPVVTDTENSLFTNVGETMPRGSFTALSFERGTDAPPEPPCSVDLISGHLHYYRYRVGGSWTSWRAGRTLAQWHHVPRRVSVGTDTARPVWFALREANADGLVVVSNDEDLDPNQNFGLRITVHTTKTASHRPISNSEFVVDGAIAAFHNDPVGDDIVAAVLPRLPGVTEDSLRHALSSCAGPLFPTPAVLIEKNSAVRISPADHRCWLGSYSVRQDSTSRWPEFSGELFTLLPIDSAKGDGGDAP
ncbi:hypothetical protein PT015_08375 [Candidatus Mycobacterium wuenschmannii]|uniref:Uncharacterized protein n=1 Tax=Candidatus Mycobacterium wuenschmannii TaxID=3027808 RepID=A0ABY8W6M5_9MYCO|nr:hypothetical protein [Candidatus Mycobacterium wuenschmannii]WIM89439.1 hypothetical protein PT015_08375 [Candidatus Mycobacterium wuenschmannii]